MSPIEIGIRQRHKVVDGLLAQGHGILEIGSELHVGAIRVPRTATPHPQDLLIGRSQARRSRLDSYKPHLDSRLGRRTHHAILLHTELQDFDYQSISNYLRPRRELCLIPAETDTAKPPTLSVILATGATLHSFTGTRERNGRSNKPRRQLRRRKCRKVRSWLPVGCAGEPLDDCRHDDGSASLAQRGRRARSCCCRSTKARASPCR